MTKDKQDKTQRSMSKINGHQAKTIHVQPKNHKRLKFLTVELEKDFEMAVNGFISDVEEKWSLKHRIDALIGSIFIKPIENFVNWLKK